MGLRKTREREREREEKRARDNEDERERDDDNSPIYYMKNKYKWLRGLRLVLNQFGST